MKYTTTKGDEWQSPKGPCKLTKEDGFCPSWVEFSEELLAVAAQRDGLAEALRQAAVALEVLALSTHNEFARFAHANAAEDARAALSQIKES